MYYITTRAKKVTIAPSQEAAITFRPHVFTKIPTAFQNSGKIWIAVVLVVAKSATTNFRGLTIPLMKKTRTSHAISSAFLRVS